MDSKDLLYSRLFVVVEKHIKDMFEEIIPIGKTSKDYGPAHVTALVAGMVGFQFCDLIKHVFDDDKDRVRKAIFEAFEIGFAGSVGEALDVLRRSQGTPPTGKPPSVN